MRVFGVLLLLCAFAPIWVQGDGFVELFGDSGLGFSDLLPGYAIVAAGALLLVLSFTPLTKDIKGAAAVVLLLVLPPLLGVNLFELKDLEQQEALRKLGIVWSETAVQTWMLLAGVVAAAAGMLLRDHHPKLQVGRIVIGSGLLLVLAYFFLPSSDGTPLLLAIEKVKQVTSADFEGNVLLVFGVQEGPKMLSQLKLQVFLRFAFYLIPIVLILLSLPAALKPGDPGKAGGGHGAIVAWAWRLFIPAVYFPMAIKMGLMTKSLDVFLGYARMYLITTAVVVVVPGAIDAILSHHLAPNRGMPDLAEEDDGSVAA
jgi:hypothetical protein